MESSSQTDLAVSFQQQEGAQFTWDMISHILKTDQSSIQLDADPFARMANNEDELIPIPNNDNLDKVLEVL